MRSKEGARTIGSTPSFTAGTMEAASEPRASLPSAVTSSSRTFNLRGIPRKAADKTREVGFLHLPDNVRNQIYELAIFDHDRGLVLLPRGVPRKVGFEPSFDDVDLQYAERVERFWPWYDQYNPRLEPTVATSASAVGYCVGDEDDWTTTLRSMSMTDEELAKLTDWQILDMLDRQSEADVDTSTSQAEHSSVLGCEDTKSDIFNDATDSASPTLSAIDAGIDLCLCPCHDDAEDEDHCVHCDPSTYTHEDDAEDDNADAASDNTLPPDEGEDRESEDDTPPFECLSGECSEPDCRFCYDDPKHFKDDRNDKDWWGSNVFEACENGDLDDPEHYDMEEAKGLLYEPGEPAILMTCKEVRAQCLPVYYRRNAFSWRFLWTDYQRSCHRFKSWATSISEDNVKLLTKITFSGRHLVEEGLEFVIDIDLLEEHPYFETNVYEGATDYATKPIADAINREAAGYLWLMVQCPRARPVLSASHLCELAKIFVQGMHRDAAGNNEGWEDRGGAAECRKILSPIF